MKVDNKSVEYDVCWKYFRTITDDPSPSTNGQLKLKRQFDFLRDTINDGLFNGLLNLGGKGFDKLYMEHNGEAWIIKLEAEVFK